MSYHIVNRVKACFDCTCSVEFDWPSVWKIAWYAYNDAVRQMFTEPSCAIRGKKRDGVESCIGRKLGKVTVRLGKARLMSMFEACSASGTAGVQLDESFLLLSDNASDGNDGRGGGRAELLWDLQDSRNLSASIVLAVQQIQSQYKNTDIDTSAIFHEAKSL